MNKEKLFDEFAPVSTQEWEELIQKDLKGADYEKRLIWHTLEGLKIRPYYRQEDMEKLSHISALPNEFPFVRGSNISRNHWEIRQDIEEEDLVKANVLALEALERGADAVGLNASAVNSKDDLKKLISGIHPGEKALHFQHSSHYNTLFNDFTSLIPQNTDTDTIRGSLNFDPLAYFLLYGNFYLSEEESYNEAMQLLISAKQLTPHFSIININGQNYHNAGAHAVQELAFTLSQGNHYLAELTNRGLSVDDVASHMQFTFSVGSHYFLEIAKLRAVKMLWAKIVEQYNPAQQKSMIINIHAITSSWNKSIYDSYVNMLRTSTEAMAAGIAGVNTMTVQPFDSTYKKSDAFSARIARNQQIILREEAYFSKVADPAAGSYYIEKITDTIAEAAWKLFVEMEEKGGFVKAVETGFIFSEIEKTCQKRDMAIAMRQQIFVGVNQYPNLQEQMLDKVQPTAKPGDLGRLRPYRGVQAFEAVRLSVENHQKKGFSVPSVYLFTWGDLTMRKARAGFATSFFGCAGYTIHEAIAGKTLEESLETALSHKADIYVLCSSDEEYAQMTGVVHSLKKNHPQSLVVVAGNPAGIQEQLDQAGVDSYIHLRTHALDALQNFNHKLGIA